MPSTCTPEGFPSRCPLCGLETNIDFSATGRDATCPRCGCLLWQSAVTLALLREKIQRETGIPPDEIPLDAPLAELGADSLDTVELVMELEEEFDINIPPEDAERIRTIEDAIRYIEWLRRKRREEDDPPE